MQFSLQKLLYINQCNLNIFQRSKVNRLCLFGFISLLAIMLGTCKGVKSGILDDALQKTFSEEDKDCEIVEGQQSLQPQRSDSVAQEKKTKLIDGKKYIDGPNFKVICNDGGVDETAPTVSALPGDGNYGRAQYIELSASEVATIFYTTDGSIPNGNSPQYSEPIFIDTSTVLRFYAIDLSGNLSPVNTLAYVIDSTLPTVSIALVSRPAVSGDTSTGPSPSVDIYWQSDTDGEFRVELGGSGFKGAGKYLLGGDAVGEPQSMVTSIPGSELEVGDNTIYIYLTNDLGITGFTSVAMPREDTPPIMVTNIVGGYYGAAQNVTIAVGNESYGMMNIYYTTDGTDPTLPPNGDEPDGDADGTSDICESSPFRPRPGYRCKIAFSDYTSPIKIEPYYSATNDPDCPNSGPTTDILDCDRLVALKYFGEDVAGNFSGITTVDYDVDMRVPEVLATSSNYYVRSSSTVTISYNPMITGACQVSVNPGAGLEATWGTGTVIETITAPSCIAAADRQVIISSVNIPGPSGTISNVVIRNRLNGGSPIGTTVIEVVRDDTPPFGSLLPSSGTYGLPQFLAGAEYQNGIEIAAADNLSPKAALNVHYTMDDTPVNPGASPSEPGDGFIPILSVLDVNATV